MGWYYDGGDIVRDPSDGAFTPGRSPALLLPDNTKNPTNFEPALGATWTAFLAVLRRATHVLVIGYSLNDKHLVTALTNNRRQRHA